MSSSKRRAGLAAAIGLTGSLVLGASVSSAAPSSEDGTRATTLAQTRPGAPVPLSRKAAAPADDRLAGSAAPSVCRGLVPYPIPEPFRLHYLCGDWRLGPKQLPTRGPVGSTLKKYERLGGLTAVRLLATWWDPAADAGQGDWRYPPDDGYEHNTRSVIAAPLELHAGQTVDRFGNEAGRFLAPAGTKYGQRSIPPSSLNTNDPRHPFDYHLYRVTRDVTVCAGPTAPAFGQPGLGIQYVTSSQFCPKIPRASVGDLVRNGTLVRLNTTSP